MSAHFKRKQDKAARYGCVCPRRSSSNRSKRWKLSRKVPYGAWDDPAAARSGPAAVAEPALGDGGRLRPLLGVGAERRRRRREQQQLDRHRRVALLGDDPVELGGGRQQLCLKVENGRKNVKSAPCRPILSVNRTRQRATAAYAHVDPAQTGQNGGN